MNSIEIGTGFNNLIDESTKELKYDIGTNDQELTLFWRPGYSGFTTIKAIPRDCPGSEGSYTIVVPEQQKISHIINDDTNGELNQTIRLGESIDEIKFELLGAATGVMSEAQ